MKMQRAQRPTLTYSQMYGSGMDVRGMQEGKGIFDAIGNFLKKTKIISTIGKIVAPVVGLINPAAGAAVGVATAAASQLGVGLPKKIKSLSAMQIEALKRGFGKVLKSGGISLTKAKPLFPGIKNITKTQMKAIQALRGRHMVGGGVSLAGGRATGLRGMGFSGMGVKLAGTGISLAGGRMHGGQFVARKKKVGRPRKRMAGGQIRAQVCPPVCPMHGAQLRGGQLKILPFLKAVAKSPAVKKKLAAARKRAAARRKAQAMMF